MICGNPALDQLEEILCFRDNLLDLRVSCDRRLVVVDHIALAPARFKEIEMARGRSTKRQPGRFKRNPVVTRYTCRLIACGQYGHFGSLQPGIVGGGKATVVGERLDRRVLKIAGDDCPQLVQFFLVCFVRANLALCLQLFPAHPEPPRS